MLPRFFGRMKKKNGLLSGFGGAFGNGNDDINLCHIYKELYLDYELNDCIFKVRNFDFKRINIKIGNKDEL
jgi:hypothetical protein